MPTCSIATTWWSKRWLRRTMAALAGLQLWRPVHDHDSFCDTLATCLARPTVRPTIALSATSACWNGIPWTACILTTTWPRELYPCKNTAIPSRSMTVHRTHEQLAARQAIKEGCPHAVLIDHSSHAFASHNRARQPPLRRRLYVPFRRDVPGHFRFLSNMYAQGCLWAGDRKLRAAVQTATPLTCLPAAASTVTWTGGSGRINFLCPALTPTNRCSSDVQPRPVLFWPV